MAVTIKKGSKGEWVKALQYILAVSYSEVKVDGKFGSKTQAALKKYQKANGLTADGVAGKNTWSKIKSKAPTLRVGATGTYVYVLECLLSTMYDDGHFKQDELQHVKTYQSAKKLDVDGVVGPKTWAALFEIEEDKLVVSNTATGTNTSKPVDYKQYDSRWGSIVYTRNNTYNKNQTIKSSGCGPTACADIIATFFDKSVTPVPLAAFSVAKGYRTQNSGTDWDFFEAVAKEFKASKFLQTSSYNTAKAAQDDGALVVVSVRKSRWTNGGHFICWWDTDSKYVYINDPASASSSRAKAPYSELKTAAKQYFCIWK